MKSKNPKAKLFFATLQYREDDELTDKELQLHLQKGKLCFDEETTVELLMNPDILRIINRDKEIERRRKEADARLQALMITQKNVWED